MRKVIIGLFIIFMLGFLLLEIITVVDLVNDKQPPTVWIGDEH